MTGFLPKTSYRTTTFSNNNDPIRSCSTIQEQLTHTDPTLNSNAFRSILPYRSLDADLMFMNKKSIGFGLHIIPAADPDDQLITSIVELIKNQLPSDIDCTVMLHKHQHINTTLQRGLQPMLSKGNMFARLAEASLNTHLNAITETKGGDDAILQLHDYRCYLFLSTHHHLDDKSILIDCRNNIEMLLNQAKLTHARIEEADFLVLMRSLVAPNLTSTEWPSVSDIHHTTYNHIIPPANTSFSLGKSSIEVASHDAKGVPIQTRIVNCQLQSWPNDHALKQTADLFAQVCRPELHLPCNFLISVTLRGRNRVGIHPIFYNLMLFTTPSQESVHINQVAQAYQARGFTLQLATATQWLCFLTSLPFFITEGYYHELNLLNMIKKMTSNHVMSLMPIIADRKGSRQGLLLPTRSQQVSFLNTFDNQNHPIINFNYLMAVASDKRNRVFQHAQTVNGLALGEIIFVLDLDQSYTSLCETVDGHYIDATSTAFNPFMFLNPTNTTDRKLMQDLLAIMTNPNHAICATQQTHIRDAIETCCKTKKTGITIDDILDDLNEQLLTSTSFNNEPLNSLIVRLKQYGRHGIYSALFNGNASIINEDQLIVFDLHRLQNNPDVLTTMICIMIVNLLKYFQQIDPVLKKRCIIDNAQLHLTASNNPIIVNLIQQQFQIARQYNSGFGIITNSFANLVKTQQGQAVAAACDMKFIMHASNMKTYANAFPHRIHPIQHGIIAAFEETVDTRYYDILIETGNAQGFCRYFIPSGPE